VQSVRPERRWVHIRPRAAPGDDQSGREVDRRGGGRDDSRSGPGRRRPGQLHRYARRRSPPLSYLDITCRVRHCPNVTEMSVLEVLITPDRSMPTLPVFFFIFFFFSFFYFLLFFFCSVCPLSHFLLSCFDFNFSSITCPLYRESIVLYIL